MVMAFYPVWELVAASIEAEPVPSTYPNTYTVLKVYPAPSPAAVRDGDSFDSRVEAEPVVYFVYREKEIPAWYEASSLRSVQYPVPEAVDRIDSVEASPVSDLPVYRVIYVVSEADRY